MKTTTKAENMITEKQRGMLMLILAEHTSQLGLTDISVEKLMRGYDKAIDTANEAIAHEQLVEKLSK